MALALLPPLAEHFVDLRIGRRSDRAPSAAAGPVTSRSRSPTVSRPRRRLPAAVIFSTPCSSPRYVGELSATPVRRSSAGSVRCCCRYCAIERRTFSSSLAPMRGSVAQLLLLAELLQLVDGADLEMLEEQRDALRPEALNFQKFERGRRDISAAARRAARKIRAR